MSEHAEFNAKELLPLYALGELDPEETSLMESALAEDAGLRAELDSWRNDLGEMLAESAEPIPLAASKVDALEQRLLSRVREADAADAAGNTTLGSSPRSTASVESAVLAPEFGAVTSDAQARSSSWMMPLALAASLLSLGVAFWAVGGRASKSDLERLRGEKAALSNEVASLRAALDRNSEEIARVSTSLQTFGYPRSETIVLAGLEPAPAAKGAAFYRPSSKGALFFAFGLPGIDAASVYQLWYITDQGPVSAGTFTTDAAGDARVMVANVPDQDQIKTWAVTREPAGGSVQPTGPMLIKS